MSNEEEEIIGQGSEIMKFRNALDFAQLLQDEASLNSYKNSAWKKMVEQWRKEHPQIKKVLSLEEKEQSEKELESLNLEWRRIQKLKESEKQEAQKRIHDQWLIHENNKTNNQSKKRKKK